MQPEPFGPYTLLQHIAVGGMGELFLARRRGAASYSSHVVLKRIRRELLSQSGFVEMFLTEGRVAALLDHPNVVRTYELGEVEGTYFIAMEYVDGRDLGALLSKLRAPLELSSALHVMFGVCEGIEHAHGLVDGDGHPLNLVHRDINPHNILVSYGGAVKVTDFGIAKVPLFSADRTMTGVVKGKYAYLSPEQALGRRVDRRSDIYALGLLLFEITTGQRANPGASDTEMLLSATQGLRQMPSALLPAYPRDLETIYRRATAPVPEDRYCTARDLEEDLLAFQLQHGLIVSPRQLAELMQRTYAEELAREQLALEPGRLPAVEVTLPPLLVDDTASPEPQLSTAPVSPGADTLALSPEATLDRTPPQDASAIGSTAAAEPLADSTELSALSAISMDETGEVIPVEVSRERSGLPRPLLYLGGGVGLLALTLFFLVVSWPDAPSPPADEHPESASPPLLPPPDAESPARATPPPTPATPDPVRTEEEGSAPHGRPAAHAPTESAVLKSAPAAQGGRRGPPGLSGRRTVLRAARRPAPSVQHGKGWLDVRARPWAHVEINGARRGTTPMTPLELDDGTYQVRLIKTGAEPHVVQVTIRPGKTTKVVHLFPGAPPAP